MTENEKMIPSHWIYSKLGEVCQTTSGGTPSRKNPSFYEGNIPWVKSGELNYNIILETEEHISEDAIKKSSAKIFPKGTLLIALYGATIGKLAILGIDAATNQAVCAIFKNEIFESKFLYYLLFHKKQDLVKEGIGGAQPNISQTILKNLEVPFCPLPEQHAIVSKIEQLFSELDNGISNLKLAQEQLKVYRQAVLKKAFEGELTKKWREQQTDLLDARVLLEKIWVEREEEAKVSRKKLNKIKPLTEDELSELPRLPDKWLWVKFGEACNKIFDGTHFSPKNSPQGDIKYITAKNIKEGYLDLSDLSYVTKEDHYEIFSRCDVKKGDILYIKDGATTGKACLNPLEEEFSLLSSVGVFRVNEKYISPKYIEHYLNAEVTRHQMLKNIAGVAITRLTLVKLNNSMLILPSKEEQLVIVQEIETRLSVCDKIEQDIETNLERAEALRQSILKKAFEGKLLNEKELAEVRGAEDWEPAEVLLERIKAERVKMRRSDKT